MSEESEPPHGAGPGPASLEERARSAAPPVSEVERTVRDQDGVTSYGAQPELERSVFEVRNLTFNYGRLRAVQDVSMRIGRGEITALIGPSGCGKSTFLRCLNRMNDLIPGTRVEGEIVYHGQDIYAPDIDPVDVRRRIGMVFQKPNPFPKSVKENLTFGMRLNGIRPTDDRVEQVLRDSALWDEVKDKLKDDALSLSGGQQQRLCIARAIAVEPSVILMDEPCSALDPISTDAIESLMLRLRGEYTIVIVTHNMQQAARVADRTAFFTVRESDRGERYGVLAEYGETEQIFRFPRDPRTRDYISGRFG